MEALILLHHQGRELPVLHHDAATPLVLVAAVEAIGDANGLQRFQRVHSSVHAAGGDMNFAG